MRAKVNDVELQMRYEGLSGLTKSFGCSASYVIESVSHQSLKGVELPNSRVLKRLARVYLGSPVHEWWRTPHLCIGIKGGLSEEKRAAFLAAVTARTKIVTQ